MNFFNSLVKKKDKINQKRVSIFNAERKQHEKHELKRQLSKKEKAKQLKKKIRIFQISLIFAFRMYRIWKNIQYYGLSHNQCNPNFRKIEDIREFLQSQKKDEKRSFKRINTKKKTKKLYLFYPDQTFIIIWSIFSLIFLMYFLTIMPYLIVFNINSTFLNTFEKIIDIYFIIDIIFNFNLTFIRKDGKYEKNRKKICKHYLKNYFIIDLFTSIPISWMMSSSSTSSINKILRILKLPKLIQTVKMTKLFSLSNILKSLKLGNMWRYKIKAKEGLINTIYVSFMTYLVLHLGGCIFTYIGFYEGFYPNTWIVQEGLEFKSNQEIYISALYYCFVVLTTVGYGDIQSSNTAERIFTIIWMLFGIAFYSFTISFITFFFTSRDNRKTLYMKKLEDFLRFAYLKNLKKDLTMKIIANLEYSSHKIAYRWLEDDFQILKDMPLELKYELLKELHPKLLDSPFFYTKDQSFVVRILELLKPVKLKKGEFLWKKDEKSNYLVFISKGKLFMMIDNIFYEKLNEHDRYQKIKMIENSKEFNIIKLQRNVKKMVNTQNKKEMIQNLENLNSPEGITDIKSLLKCRLFALKLFGSGSYIGDEEIFLKTNRRYYLKAAVDAEVFLLSRIDFENILKPEFPHIYKKLIKDTQKKIIDHNTIKRQILTNLTNLAKKEGIDVTDIQMKLLEEKEDSQVLGKRSKYLRNSIVNSQVMSLRELYKKTTIETPLETIFKNLEIPEYEDDLEDDNERSSDEEYEKIKTPGLVKMHKEWKINRIKSMNHSKPKNVCFKSGSSNQMSNYGGSENSKLSRKNTFMSFKNQNQYLQKVHGFNELEQKLKESNLLLQEGEDNLEMIENILKKAK